jgi:hypothetical protein
VQIGFTRIPDIYFRQLIGKKDFTPADLQSHWQLKRREYLELRTLFKIQDENNKK